MCALFAQENVAPADSAQKARSTTRIPALF
jgi:hypothetical protein